MSQEFEINAQVRSDLGKGASRRLRRLDKQVPGIIYGGEEAPMPVSLDHNQIIRALENDAFYSHILTINIAGKTQKALLKDLHRHPYKPKILHMDFQRVTGNEIIHRHVSLHFLNEEKSEGVKQGGVVTHQLKDVEIKCSVNNLPEFIEIDIAKMKLDEVLHLSDIKLPKGVEIVALAHGEEHDLPVVAIHLPRAAVEESSTVEIEAAPTEKPASPDENA